MINPYDVLGVSKSATNDEVKQAYKHLAFKYHPSNYEKNPLSDIADSKLKEIDEAYDMIMTERSGSYNESFQYGKKPFNTTSSQYPDVRRHIHEGRIDDASTILDGIPINARTAEWYFLKGKIQQRRGWVEEANKNFTTAVEMDPYNSEFKQSYDELNKPFTNHRYYRKGKGRFKRALYNCASSCGLCNLCMGLCCLDTCCGCFGDDYC